MSDLDVAVLVDTLEKIRREANLGDDRVGIWNWGGGGDVYQMCALLPSYRAETGKTPVLIIKESQLPITKLFNQTRLEVYTVDGETNRILNMSGAENVELLWKYGIINRIHSLSLPFIQKLENTYSWLYYVRASLGLPLIDNPFALLTKPDASIIDKSYYIFKYAIVPGRTFLLCPETNSGTLLPFYFWNILADALTMLGYRVLFNISSKETANEYRGDLAFIKYEDIIGFSELCGNVVAIRSGLCDILSTAAIQFTILYTGDRYYRRLRLEEMGIANNSDGHLREILVFSEDEATALDYLDTIRKLIAHKEDDFRVFNEFKFKPQIHCNSRQNNIQYHEFRDYKYRVSDSHNDNFDNISYEAAIVNGSIRIIFYPETILLNYRINLIVKNGATIISKIDDVPKNYATFEIKNYGQYFVFVEVIKKSTHEKMTFVTEAMNFQEWNVHLTLDTSLTGYDSACEKIVALHADIDKAKYRRREITDAFHDYSYGICDYIKDNNLERVFFYGEVGDEDILAEVARSIVKDAEYLRRCVSDQPIVLIDKMMGMSKQVFHPTHFRDMRDGDTVILCLREAADNKILSRFKQLGVNTIQLLDILDIMQWMSLVCKPLKAFALTHNNSIMCIPDFMSPSYDPKEPGRLALNNNYKHNDMLRRLRNENKIPIGLSDYSVDEAKELVNMPQPEFGENGVCRFSNVTGAYVNTKDGCRATSDQPISYEYTVHLFGNEQMFGVGSRDEHTVASHLQKLLNGKEWKIRVINQSNFIGMQYYKMFKLMNSMTYMENDIIIVMHNLFPADAYLNSEASNITFYSRKQLFASPADTKLYIDPYHINGKGNEIIAERIFESLEAVSAKKR